MYKVNKEWKDVLQFGVCFPNVFFVILNMPLAMIFIYYRYNSVVAKLINNIETILQKVRKFHSWQRCTSATNI